VAQLIGDETGTELMSPYLPYGLPYTLFDRLMEAKRSDGAPLVSSVTLLPSRQTRLTSRFHALDQDQQAAVTAVTRSNTLTEEYSRLAPEKRGPVIEALFDYYSFRSVGGKEAEVFKETKRKLVMDRLQLPPSNSIDLQLPNLRPAHEGQRPFLTRLTGFDSAHFGRGFEFQFRTSYYDFLAPEFGRPKNTSVRTLDTALNFADQKVWVRRLELFGVETLNLSQTGLPGDGGFAWKFNMGFETLNLQCHNCSIFKIEGGLGQGFTPFSRQVLLFMIDGRVQSVADGSGHLGITPNASYWIEPLTSGVWKLGASMGFREYVDDKLKGEVMARFENRFGLSRNWDIRAGYEKHVDHRWSVSLSGYW